MEKQKMKRLAKGLCVGLAVWFGMLWAACPCNAVEQKDWDGYIQGLKRSQAMNAAGKRLQRYMMLMEKLAEENPDLLELDKAGMEAVKSLKAAMEKAVESPEYKAMQERLEKAQKEYKDLVARHDENPKIHEMEIHNKRNQVEALERQLKVLLDSDETVKSLKDSIMQNQNALMARLEELTRDWPEEDKKTVLDRQGLFAIDEEEAPDFSDLFKDLSQAMSFFECVDRYSELVLAELLKENPRTDKELAACVVPLLIGCDASKEMEVLKYKGNDVQEDNLKELFRIRAVMTTIPQKEWQTMRKPFLQLYNRAGKGSFTRYVIARFLSLGVEGNENRVWQALWEYTATFETLPEIYKYITEFNNINYDEDQCLLQMRRHMMNAGAKTDPWLQHLFNAAEALNRGWNARGGGYGDTVTSEGWDVYGKCMEQATAEAEAAIALHPEWVAGYNLLFHANLGDNERIHKYFAQICKYRPDATHLFVKVIWSLLPRWGGSYEEMIALAKACMETRRYDTCIPSIGFCLLGMVSWDGPITEWNRCYRMDWLPPLADELFKERIGHISPQLPRNVKLDYALYLMAAGRYEEAAAYVKELGGAKAINKEGGAPLWNPHGQLGNWYPKTAYWSMSPFDVHLPLFTGEYGDTLQALERQLLEEQWPDDVPAKLKAFLESHEKLDKEQRSWLVDWYGRMLLPNIPCNELVLKTGSRKSPWRNAFRLALEQNCPDVAVSLLKLGFDYAAHEPYPGATAISLAQRGSLPETMKMLKEMGDPLNRPEPRNGRQPLHIASYHFNPEMVKCLVDLGCDVNAVDNDRHTPLQMAAADSTTESVAYLLKHGARVEDADNAGDTALIIACQNGSREDVVGLLLDYAKDVNVANSGGMTALHYAVQNGYSADCIRHFLKAGADVQAGTTSGQTAYAIAKSLGKNDLCKFLCMPDGSEPVAKPPKIPNGGVHPPRGRKASGSTVGGGFWWLGGAVLAVLLAAAGGMALWRRRNKAS